MRCDVENIKCYRCKRLYHGQGCREDAPNTPQAKRASPSYVSSILSSPKEGVYVRIHAYTQVCVSTLNIAFFSFSASRFLPSLTDTLNVTSTETQNAKKQNKDKNNQ